MQQTPRVDLHHPQFIRCVSKARPTTDRAEELDPLIRAECVEKAGQDPRVKVAEEDPLVVTLAGDPQHATEVGPELRPGRPRLQQHPDMAYRSRPDDQITNAI